MLRTSSFILLRMAIAIIVFLAFSPEAKAQQLIHDLEQDWISYSNEHQGFLPVDQQNLEDDVISLIISNKEYNPYYLVIGVREEASLFYRNKLIATLLPGYTSFKIDSLKKSIDDKAPFLSIFGGQLLPYLTTKVYTKPIESNLIEEYEPDRFANAFSNFTYTAITILLFFFVILKVRIPEIVEQYLLIERSIRLKTIDELIYKIPYLKAPNIWVVALISSLFGFATISFMYFYPNELNVFGINPGNAVYALLITYWIIITSIIFVGIIFKYFLTVIIASVFGLNITNVHFASSLRLIFILGLMLAAIALTQFLFVDTITENYYWVALVAGLAVIEIIILLKLTLVTSHTLLYIIVYLCASEILPVVFLFKLYTA